ncbi:VirK family protein [Enterobacter kobei]|uniref:VirK family protein n=1 Tax=Enterobacter kobei TaxID=208224 RepID=UPI003CF97A46
MKKSAISFVLFIASATTGTVFAADDSSSLRDYSAIKETLISGHQVSVVTDFSKCEGSPQTGTIGGTSINSFLVLTDPKTKNERIAFSDYHQRLDDKHSTPQIDFVRYNITADNNVLVTMSMYPATTNTREASRTYTCPINTGSKFFRR